MKLNIVSATGLDKFVEKIAFALVVGIGNTGRGSATKGRETNKDATVLKADV